MLAPLLPLAVWSESGTNKPLILKYQVSVFCIFQQNNTWTIPSFLQPSYSVWHDKLSLWVFFYNLGSVSKPHPSLWRAKPSYQTWPLLICLFWGFGSPLCQQAVRPCQEYNKLLDLAKRTMCGRGLAKCNPAIVQHAQMNPTGCRL